MIIQFTHYQFWSFLTSLSWDPRSQWHSISVWPPKPQLSIAAQPWQSHSHTRILSYLVVGIPRKTKCSAICWTFLQPCLNYLPTHQNILLILVLAVLLAASSATSLATTSYVTNTFLLPFTWTPSAQPRGLGPVDPYPALTLVKPWPYPVATLPCTGPRTVC